MQVQHSRIRDSPITKKKKLSNKQEKQLYKKKRHTCMLSICYYVHFITSGR